ncbi:MAG: hypothetical protein OSA11_05225 [Candidatus Nanopelagicales bacterium]|nr:hypothetical protein [Candidatus Nanopelagicales bacterium]
MFMLHPVDPRAPLTEISGESRITLSKPTMAENTLVVSTDLVGCQPANYGYQQYVQVINLRAQ